MDREDLPAPTEGFVLTHFLVVSGQDRSREFYRRGSHRRQAGRELSTPPDPERTRAFLNVRAADIAETCKEWPVRGPEFLTGSRDHGAEIRAHVRDPDGHLIDVGQATGALG